MISGIGELHEMETKTENTSWWIIKTGCHEQRNQRLVVRFHTFTNDVVGDFLVVIVMVVMKVIEVDVHVWERLIQEL